MMITRRAYRAVQPCLNKSSRCISQESVKKNIQKLSDTLSSFSQNMLQQIPRNDTTMVFSRMKGSILDLMAKNMSEGDKEFLLLRWGQQSPTEKEVFPESGAKPVPGISVMPVRPPAVVVDETASSTAALPIDATKIENNDNSVALHPVFGQLLADVGYKKVYLTSARRLVLAQVWQKQRTLRPERSAGIAKVKSSNSTCHLSQISDFPVLFVFCECAGEDGRSNRVSGRHHVVQVRLWRSLQACLVMTCALLWLGVLVRDQGCQDGHGGHSGRTAPRGGPAAHDEGG